jgi:hypothetical protein
MTFDFEPVMRSAREHGDVLHYVYIDRTWEKPERLAFFLERMKYAALATFGLARYVPSGHLLVVQSSPPCQAADGIDWRNVWNRDYVGAIPAETEAKNR